MNSDCVRLFNGRHTSAVCSIACSPDGKHLVSGGEDGKVILWDLDKAQCLDEWSSERLPLPEVDISTAAITGKLPESSGALAHTRTVTSVTYSADGNIIATGSLDGTIKLWNPSRKHKNALIKTLKTNATPVTTLRFTPRNVLLAAGIFSPNI
jgi:WD40 repeat protein